MYRTRSLISFCLLAELIACAYSFSPSDYPVRPRFSLEPSTNATQLIEANMVLDRHLERAMSELAMLDTAGKSPSVSCELTAARRERRSASSLSTTDRYRLVITVRARLIDSSGKGSWEKTFTEWGRFAEGETDEAALDEACRKISLSIAHALASTAR